MRMKLKGTNCSAYLQTYNPKATGYTKAVIVVNTSKSNFSHDMTILCPGRPQLFTTEQLSKKGHHIPARSWIVYQNEGNGQLDIMRPFRPSKQKPTLIINCKVDIDAIKSVN